MITATNKKNAKHFNKAVQWLIKHNKANDLRTIAEDNDDTKEWRKQEKICVNTFDKYEEYCDLLPKYEVKRIEKSDLY